MGELCYIVFFSARPSHLMAFVSHSAVLLLLLLASLYAPAQDSIPIKIASGAVLVPVKIKERILSFLLDTGSERSLIDPSTAANLGLASHGTERIEKNFRDLVVDATEADAIRIGNHDFNRVELAEVTLAPIAKALGMAVDGVLGNDILEQITFKLCYSNQTLLVGSLPELGALGQSAALRRSGNQFFASITLISVPTDLVLDTGTNSTNLSWKTWELMNRGWTPKEIVQGIARAGNPTSSAILVCLPSVQFGSVTLVDQAVRAQEQSDAGAFSSENFGGILGSDILQQFVITFDLRNNTIFLQPDPQYKRDSFRYITIGIQIAKNDQGTFQIMSVWKDSPAAHAGVQQGDVLKAVDAKPVETLTTQQVSSMLHAKEGTEIRLAIERNAKVSTVVVTTRALLCTHDHSHGESRQPR
jgi:hypothetical protein